MLGVQKTTTLKMSTQKTTAQKIMTQKTMTQNCVWGRREVRVQENRGGRGKGDRQTNKKGGKRENDNSNHFLSAYKVKKKNSVLASGTLNFEFIPLTCCRQIAYWWRLMLLICNKSNVKQLCFSKYLNSCSIQAMLYNFTLWKVLRDQMIK